MSSQSTYITRDTKYSLEQIKELVEKMNKHHQIEILKIIHKYPAIKINENKNGIYINLAYLSEDVLEEIYKYIDYTEQQESSLNTLELQKNEFKNTFFDG
jgi:DNA-binding transcriptional MerR regulator